MDERLEESGEEISKELKARLLSIFSEQENFSKVRTVDKASVKLRFRIMTEVKAEGNILNSRKYPAILDNTLNFILPCHDDKGEDEIREKLGVVFSRNELQQLSIFKIKHYFNGYFLVVQTPI